MLGCEVSIVGATQQPWMDIIDAPAECRGGHSGVRHGALKLHDYTNSQGRRCAGFEPMLLSVQLELSDHITISGKSCRRLTPRRMPVLLHASCCFFAAF